jgi:hypothetical protein
MSLRRKPHERGFYPLFAEAGRNIEAAAGNLAALMASHPDGRPALATRVKEAERRGDELTREVLLKLKVDTSPSHDGVLVLAKIHRSGSTSQPPTSPTEPSRGVVMTLLGKSFLQLIAF